MVAVGGGVYTRTNPPVFEARLHAGSGHPNLTPTKSSETQWSSSLSAVGQSPVRSPCRVSTQSVQWSGADLTVHWRRSYRSCMQSLQRLGQKTAWICHDSISHFEDDMTLMFSACSHVKVWIILDSLCFFCSFTTTAWRLLTKVWKSTYNSHTVRLKRSLTHANHMMTRNSVTYWSESKTNRPDCNSSLLIDGLHCHCYYLQYWQLTIVFATVFHRLLSWLVIKHED